MSSISATKLIGYFQEKKEKRIKSVLVQQLAQNEGLMDYEDFLPEETEEDYYDSGEGQKSSFANGQAMTMPILFANPFISN